MTMQHQRIMFLPAKERTAGLTPSATKLYTTLRSEGYFLLDGDFTELAPGSARGQWQIA